jgi:hypothetical protein
MPWSAEAHLNFYRRKVALIREERAKEAEKNKEDTATFGDNLLKKYRRV